MGRPAGGGIVSDVNLLTGRCRDCGRLAATCRATSCRSRPADGTGARESFAGLKSAPPTRPSDVAPLLSYDGCDVCGEDVECAGCAPLDEVAV